MAKCTICNSKKGKRHCSATDTLICSLCCGNTRKPDLCLGCGFYQKPKRKYGDVPAYSVSEMDGNMELEAYGNAIEGALCSYDVENNNKVRDNDAIKIIESLIDIHYFKDTPTTTGDQIVVNGVNYVEEVIKKDLQELSDEIIVKILGVIRFVAKRRTKTGREYMDIIHRYVGQRIDTGIRVLPQ